MVLADSHRISRVPCYLGYFPSGSSVSNTGFAPSMTGRSRPFFYTTCLLLKVGRPSGKSHNPKHATPAGYHTCLVWPLPRSLATTNGITVVFSSCGYLDVSLPHVPSTPPIHSAGSNQIESGWVSPFGNPRIKVCLSTPRGLSQIATSFFGSYCQGIHRVLFET